jgi:hypothetical protein
MKFSRRTVDTLLDLVEMKLASIEVTDREDARERATLETARSELLEIRAAIAAARLSRRTAAAAEPVASA